MIFNTQISGGGGVATTNVTLKASSNMATCYYTDKNMAYQTGFTKNLISNKPLPSNTLVCVLTNNSVTEATGLTQIFDYSMQNIGWLLYRVN